MDCFLDIETVPTDRDDVIADIDAKYPLELEPSPITPDKRFTDPDKIKHDIEVRSAAAELAMRNRNSLAMEKRGDAFRATALDGNVGRIVSIAWAFNDQPEIGVTARDPDEFGEAETLMKFFGALAEAPLYTRLIAHHAEFDLRFIYQRAVICGVANAIPPWWPTLQSSRTDERRVFCTMTRWAGFGNRIGLDRLCINLGLPGKGDVTGADVESLWRKHDYASITRYNSDDIRRLRSVYRRMNGGKTLVSDITGLLGTGSKTEAA